MQKTISRFISIILIISFIFISVSILSSCGKDDVDDDEGKVAFAPPNREYEVMLDPAEWSEIMVSTEYSPDQLGLLNDKWSFILTIDFYRKADLVDFEVSEMNSFIDFYKTFDTPKNMYTPDDSKRFGELTDVAENDIKGSIFKGGKRQEIYGQGEEVNIICQLVYLETENHYFALSYLCFEDKFDGGQKAVNDVISRLKTIK